MNERIQQMIYNLNEKVGVHWTNEDKIKFAELIILECATWLEETVVECELAGELLRHFGVE